MPRRRACWGYYRYVGVMDPNGGVNILWPLFGISNQMLAGIALSVATGILVKSGKLRVALVTLIPLSWLALITTTAACQQLVCPDIRDIYFVAGSALSGMLDAGTK